MPLTEEWNIRLISIMFQCCREELGSTTSSPHLPCEDSVDQFYKTAISLLRDYLKFIYSTAFPEGLSGDV